MPIRFSLPLVHASYVAGSIRIPAANCGVIGFKPSCGGNLLARALHLIDDVLCSDMLVARTMRDVCAAFDVVATSHLHAARPAICGLRVGLPLNGLAELAAAAFFEQFDVLLSPVAQEPPIALGRHAPDRDFTALWEDFWLFVNFTPVHQYRRTAVDHSPVPGRQRRGSRRRDADDGGGKGPGFARHLRCYRRRGSPPLIPARYWPP